MGRVYSRGRGRKQATGGTSQRNPNSNNNAAPNDDADFFCKPSGQEAVFTPDELSSPASNLQDGDITSKTGRFLSFKRSWKSCLDSF